MFRIKRLPIVFTTFYIRKLMNFVTKVEYAITKIIRIKLVFFYYERRSEVVFRSGAMKN
jgi:hypothetical protein